MNKHRFSATATRAKPLYGKTLTIALIAAALLWAASATMARPGFGGGHFGGPRMNIHPGFAGGAGIRPVGPARPIGNDLHRVAPYQGPRPQHRGPEGDGDDHHDVHRHGRYWPYPAPGYWAGAAAGATAGAIVYSLPGGCIKRVEAGVTYEECSGTWYRPSYAGTQVVYEVVAAP